MRNTQPSATPNRFHWICLVALIQTFYFFINWSALGPFHAIPELSFDRMIAFDPRWIWIYFSWYAFLIAAIKDEDAKPVALGIAGLAYVSYAIFLFFPTMFNRPELVGPVTLSEQLTALAFFLDQPTNVLPSLHVSTTVFVVLRKLRGPVPTVWWSWGALIIFSCLALKQHLVIDAIAGSTLGFAVFFIAESGVFNKKMGTYSAPILEFQSKNQ